MKTRPSPRAGVGVRTRELAVTARAGASFRIRHVPDHRDGDIVEVVHAAGPFPIASYTKATFLTVDGGLALNLSDPTLVLDDETVTTVQAWLREVDQAGATVLRLPLGG